MLILDESNGQLALANIVRWYGHVLSREDGHVSRKVFEVDGERKKWRLV